MSKGSSGLFRDTAGANAAVLSHGQDLIASRVMGIPDMKSQNYLDNLLGIILNLLNEQDSLSKYCQKNYKVTTVSSNNPQGCHVQSAHK